MRAERMCSLARFVQSLQSSPQATLAGQWLERTLDDSVNRRLTLVICCLSVGVTGIGLSIVNVALPSISRDLHARLTAETRTPRPWTEPPHRRAEVRPAAVASGLVIPLLRGGRRRIDLFV